VSTTTCRKPAEYIDAQILHLTILLAARRDEKLVHFDAAVTHAPLPADGTDMPECGVCETWMCAPYRRVVDELIGLRVVDPGWLKNYSS
jgi:hypothetical protein